MKKALTGVFILAILALVGSVLIFPSATFYKSIATSIRVIEGSVMLFWIKPDGSRSNPHILNEGQTEIVKGSVVNESHPLFITMRPVFQEVAEQVVAALESATTHLPDRFTHVFTEKEWNGLVAKRLQKVAPGSRVSFVISPRETRAYGTYVRGRLRVEGAVQATLSVDESGELAVRFRGIRVGGVDMPDFLLRYAEQMFRQAVSEGRLPIRITQIEYAEGGIRVTGQKVDRGKERGA